MVDRFGNQALRLLLLGLLCGLGDRGLLQSRSALAAQQLNAQIGNQTVRVPVSDLAQFATTGKVSPRLAPLAKQLGEPTLSEFRSILNDRLPLTPADTKQLTSIPFTEPILRNLGNVLQPQAGRNGLVEVKTAINRAAATSDGLSLLSVIRQYPGDAVWVDVPYLIQFVSAVTVQTEYRDAAVRAIAQQAKQEATTAKVPTALPDLRQAGEYTVSQRSFTFRIQAPRATVAGLVNQYDLPVDLYLPQGLRQPAPVVVLSHGFGATRASYVYLSRHLASHGFVVAAPEHVGSDYPYRDLFLKGKLSDIVAPTEYLSRSRDITYLLDELEKLNAQSNALPAQLNLQQVGVIGNSLGGTTALAMAGAPINLSRLRSDCNQDRITFTLSFLVQCLAQKAGTQNQVNVGDRRVKAVIGTYPLTSSIFGPESLSQITIPTLMISGSADNLSSPVLDQIHPFIWLKTTPKYLMMMQSGTHFSSSEDADVASFPKALVGSNLNIGRSYLQSMSTAFLKTYLNDQPRSDFQPYLTAAYAQSISQSVMPLYLIQSLTATQLEQAYGKTPPTPIVPNAIAER